MKSISAWCFAVLLSLWAAQAYAQVESDVPTDITSDRMNYQQDKQRIVFEGNVTVVRPDLNLWSDTLTVYFAAQSAQGVQDDPAGDIEKIVAEGNVRIEREGRVGTCQVAVYDMIKQVIVMEGNPVLMDGKNRVQGQRITFYLADNRSEVTGGDKERVKARFFTPPEEAQDR
ncbi:MAG: LptA/OstA family protein [Desulfovibrionales bacterium]